LITSEWGSPDLAQFEKDLNCPKPLPKLFVGTDEHLVEKDGKKGATAERDVTKTVIAMSDRDLAGTLQPFLQKLEIAMMFKVTRRTRDFFEQVCKLMKTLDPEREVFLVNSTIGGQTNHRTAIAQGRKILLVANYAAVMNGNDDFDFNAPCQTTIFYGDMLNESKEQLSHWCRILGRGGRGERKNATLVVSVCKSDLPTVKTLTELAGGTFGGLYDDR
jgi:hypothetical protein